MAEETVRLCGFSSGLAVVLNGNGRGDVSQNAHLVSCCDDIGRQSLEQTLEYILDLPCKTIHHVRYPIDTEFIRSLLRQEISKLDSSIPSSCEKDGVCVTVTNGHDPDIVMIDEASVCGKLNIVKEPLVIESLSLFSSARVNACVWKGRWMYEVILETSGIQQLGWTSSSCSFTDHKGVGDAEDSYAFDGRRVNKWNKGATSYGQSWVVGDVIGCCIDLDLNEISFYRNGISLGVAFNNIRKLESRNGYYPAVSLSQGECCDLNFGARPFKFPIDGYLPLQAPPRMNHLVSKLLKCLMRILDLQDMEKSDTSSIERLRRLKRFPRLQDVFYPICRAIFHEIFNLTEGKIRNAEYIGWGSLVSFFLEVFGMQIPHGYRSIDKILNVLLEFPDSHLFCWHMICSLSCSCKTASLVLTDCPYTGSYPYLALACHILRHRELMIMSWKSRYFEFILEGFLSRKNPNKQDLQGLMPVVWWPGSCDDLSSESSMSLATSALSRAFSKIEEMHRELCCLIIQFVPPSTPVQLPGSVFRTFLQNIMLKNRGAGHNSPPVGGSNNSVLVSLYTVILNFLSEGFPMADICGWAKCSVTGFLHRGGQQRFPTSLLLNPEPYRADIIRLGGSFIHLQKSHPVCSEVEEIQWEEGCMDDKGTKVTHSTRQKPCCCSSSYVNLGRTSKHPIMHTTRGSSFHCPPRNERSSHVTAECSSESLDDEIIDKPSTSDNSEADFGYRMFQNVELPRASYLSSEILKEEELLDYMLLLYHLGLATNFKQASFYMSHQSQSISLLDDTDKQLKEKSCAEQIKRLKEARNVYREELIDCVRHCSWYKISLLSRWKQRGMYATCMWLVQLLLVLSKTDTIFVYIPEFYLEALVDCFHALRRSDPPFVSSADFINQGLSSFITFVVTHFNDNRISNPDLKDILLQSISVLVQYKDFLVAFEINKAATQIMPQALLLEFDNRSWIPVTNILLRLIKGSGFGSPMRGESGSSVLFQVLIRETCIHNDVLLSSFINRLFNTLSWTMTEFSVLVREMQEKYQVLELQQRKCSVIFDLSCNLARLLEFFTHEIPQAFLVGSEMNLRRLTEWMVFVLNHMISGLDADVIDQLLRRHDQSSDKINQSMILAPLVGIILNLIDACKDQEKGVHNDVMGMFASMECPKTIQQGFQYLLDYNWGNALREDSVLRLRQFEDFSICLMSKIVGRENTESSYRTLEEEQVDQDSICCICFASEQDTLFQPCYHKSCFGCITRHLLNSQKCFFCNAVIEEILRCSI